MNEKKSRAGGARPGSGRKPLPEQQQKKKQRTIVLTDSEHHKLAELAKVEGISASALVTRWVEENEIKKNEMKTYKIYTGAETVKGYVQAQNDADAIEIMKATAPEYYGHPSIKLYAIQVAATPEQAEARCPKNLRINF